MQGAIYTLYSNNLVWLFSIYIVIKPILYYMQKHHILYIDLLGQVQGFSTSITFLRTLPYINISPESIFIPERCFSPNPFYSFFYLSLGYLHLALIRKFLFIKKNRSLWTYIPINSYSSASFYLSYALITTIYRIFPISTPCFFPPFTIYCISFKV